MLKKELQTMSKEEFEKIYDIFWSKLFSLAYNYFRDRTMAQELVQDVFVNLWLKRERLPHIEDLNAYLFRSMKNKIYDQYDKIASQQKLVKKVMYQFKEESHATEETLEYEEALDLINQEIEKLPVTTRTIFRLSRFDRYTNDEIASRMQVSAKAVEYHITLALKRLRPRLDHLIIYIAFLSMLKMK